MALNWWIICPCPPDLPDRADAHQQSFGLGAGWAFAARRTTDGWNINLLMAPHRSASVRPAHWNDNPPTGGLSPGSPPAQAIPSGVNQFNQTRAMGSGKPWKLPSPSRGPPSRRNSLGTGPGAGHHPLANLTCRTFSLPWAFNWARLAGGTPKTLPNRGNLQAVGHGAIPCYYTNLCATKTSEDGMPLIA